MKIELGTSTLLENTGDIVLSYEAPNAKVVFIINSKRDINGYTRKNVLVVSELQDVQTNLWNVATVTGVTFEMACAFITLAAGVGEHSGMCYATKVCYPLCAALIEALANVGVTVAP